MMPLFSIAVVPGRLSNLIPETDSREVPAGGIKPRVSRLVQVDGVITVQDVLHRGVDHRRNRSAVSIGEAVINTTQRVATLPGMDVIQFRDSAGCLKDHCNRAAAAGEGGGSSLPGAIHLLKGNFDDSLNDE